jgi:hypothetical protein
VLVVLVHTELEDVVLRQADVLEQLPGGVLEPWRTGTALGGGNPVNRLVESHVRLFPVEQPDEMIAIRLILHSMIIRQRVSCREDLGSHRRRVCIPVSVIAQQAATAGTVFRNLSSSRRCAGPEPPRGMLHLHP